MGAFDCQKRLRCDRWLSRTSGFRREVAASKTRLAPDQIAVGVSSSFTPALTSERQPTSGHDPEEIFIMTGETLASEPVSGTGKAERHLL